MINLCRLLIFLLVLHPQHKLEYFRNAGWEEAWITTAQRIVEDVYKRCYASRDIIPGPNVEVFLPVNFSKL